MGINGPTKQCDFCGSTEIEWSYPAKNFAILVGGASVGGWAACATCHEIMEAGEWGALAERTVTLGSMPIEALSFVNLLYSAFRASRKGPARRVDIVGQSTNPGGQYGAGGPASFWNPDATEDPEDPEDSP